MADGGVERGEHARVGHDGSTGEPIEERAFAGVGVADEADGGERDGLAGAALKASRGADVFEFVGEAFDAAADFAAVHFELGFAGALSADAATEAGHGQAHARKPREDVFELSEFDLEFAFTRAGAAGKDVEDELSAIDDAHFQLLFEVAELGGRKVVIDDDKVGVQGCGFGGDLLDLAAADQSGGFGLGAELEMSGDDLGARADGESAQFGQRIFR